MEIHPHWVIQYIPGERELMCILNPNFNILFEVCTLRDGFICMKGWICLFVCMPLDGNFCTGVIFGTSEKSINMKIRIESDLF